MLARRRQFAVIAGPARSAPPAASRRASEAFRAENRTSNGGLVSGSIGIAIYPNDAVDRESLMSHADAALYRAKVEGRGTYRFFEAAMGAEVKERRQIEYDLLHAVSRGQLRLAYQPQARLATREVIGFEALLRWQHPQRGAISPAIFIPIAEESGLILQIGEWVLPRAWRLQAAQALIVASYLGGAASLVTVAFWCRICLEQAHAAPPGARNHGNGAGRDRTAPGDAAPAQGALGVGVAMDDFGTGYSRSPTCGPFVRQDRRLVHPLG